MRSFKQALTMAFVVPLLAGCGAAVTDQLTSQSLRAESRGVVILRMSNATGSCENSRVVIGKKSPEGFEPTHAHPFIPTPRGTYEFAQIQLDAGEYHVIEWRCSNRTRVGFATGAETKVLGQKDAGGFFTANYRRSFASFTVAPGEIVNAGHIHAFEVAANTISLAITDLSADERQRLAQSKPNIAAQMITRLARITPVELTPEQQKVLCGQHAAVGANGQGADLPRPAGCATTGPLPGMHGAKARRS